MTGVQTCALPIFDGSATTEIYTLSLHDALPITAETRAGGLAGDLLVAVTRSGSFQLNDIVRISGPFTDLIQSRLGAAGR